MTPENSPKIDGDDADLLPSRPTARKARPDPSAYSAFEDEARRLRAGDFLADFAQQERS